MLNSLLLYSDVPIYLLLAMSTPVWLILNKHKKKEKLCVLVCVCGCVTVSMYVSLEKM